MIIKKTYPIEEICTSDDGQGQEQLMSENIDYRVDIFSIINIKLVRKLVNFCNSIFTSHH